MPEGTLGTAVNVASTLLGAHRIKYKWHIRARLDVKGFDVTKKIQVYIN